MNKAKEFFNNKNEIIMLLVIAVFYMGIFAIYGVTLCEDSNGYINMVSAREPVYPIYLLLLRSVFGKNLYLSVAVFLQNVLMIYAVWGLVTYLVKRFSLNPVAGYMMILVDFGVEILCQFVALRSAMYANSIGTEALAIPLWLIFITILFKTIDSEEKYVKNVIILSLMTALMMDVRKQMLMGFPVMFAIIFLVNIKKKNFIKKMLIMVAAIIGAFIIALSITRIYNYCLRGEFKQNTRDMNLVVTTSLYVADVEDAALIKEETTRKLFIKTMDILEKNKITYKYAGSSLSELNEHYGESFDKITIDTTATLFVDYAIEQGFKPGMEAEAEADRMSKVIVESLLMDNISHYIRVYISSVYDGMINTVAKRSNILDIMAMIIILCYTVVLVMCLLNKKLRTEGLYGLTVLIAVMVNVCATAAVIFCQTRYMIYNMALFYILFIVMICGFVKQILLNKNANAEFDSRNI